MNILSSKVSATKGFENLKKNSDIRASLLILSKKSDSNSESEKFYSNFSKSNNIDEQIKKIRELSNELTKNIDINLRTQVLQILCDVYFEAPVKHPVKNTIVKILLQANPNLRDEIVQCLSNTLRSMLDNHILNTNAEKLNECTNAFCGCLENFPPGRDTIKMSLEDVVSFLNHTIDIYLMKLRNSLSPTQKNEYSLFLHNSIRLTQSCFQQFSQQLTNSTNLTEIITKCNLVIKSTDIPMDTKINCGTIIALEAKITLTYSEFVEELISQMIKENEIRRLCLSVGFVNTFERTDIISKVNEIKNLHIIVEILSDIGKRNTLESNVILAVSRGLLQFTKKILTFDLELTDRKTSEIKHFEDIFKICQLYSLSHLEHYLDSVRHLSRDLLKNVTEICVRYKKYFPNWMPELFEIGTTQSAVLISLCNIMGAENVLQHVPNLVEILLEKLNEQTSTYEILMMRNSKEIQLDEWYDKWILPLINNLSIEGEILIKKSIKDKPEIIQKIIKEKCLSNNIALKLNCLGTARKQGYFDNIISTSICMWKNIISYDELETYMKLEDDYVVIAGLRLLAEAHRTTEIFDSREFEIILMFLECNVNCQSPSTRQQIRAYMKIILQRVHSVIPILIRSKQENEFILHFNFLKNLHTFFLKNLYHEANFSRREISLKLLLQVVEILNYTFTLCKMDNDIWNSDNVDNLLEALNDTYEINQQMAIKIMELCPKEVFWYGRIRITLGKTLNMASSKRVSETISSAYYLEFLSKISPDLDKLKLVLGTSKSVEYCESTYLALLWCYTNLQDGLKIAKKSLLNAAQKNPLYGFLFCLRHLINKLNLKLISSCSIWRTFFTKLIILCKELTDVVAPIVNNSSPEGHLPNDLGQVTNLTIDDESTINSTTPQMILLCAWRTVKEVSLLLGDISLRAPIIRDNKNGLITVNQMLMIGDHFTELLSETKHRGAFEQAYIGFSKLCIRLWSTSEQELHERPMKWLNELLNVISGEESDFSSEKLCATRRSAGIPFCVQALITSELQVCSTTALHYCMKRLIDMCRHGKTTECRTHALNILRSLFRCSELGETITEYISDSIECSIRGYDSNTWAEQNSSTLLFSSLMVRVFGVQRNRDTENLNIKNKMTGRIFFLRYPRLYDFFLNELQKSANEINFGGIKSPKLHSILLVLSRLYPSALEGSESNLKLTEFLSHISLCSSSPDYQTRCLVAKSTVALISPNRITNRILELITIVKKIYPSNDNSNLLHGIKLQALSLLRSCEMLDFNDWTKIMSSILSVSIKNRRNLFLTSTYAEILVELILLCHFNSWNTNLKEQFSTTLKTINFLYETRGNELIGQSDITNSFILLNLFDSIHLNNVDLITSTDLLLYKTFDGHSLEYVDTIFNLILLIIDYENCEKLISDFEIRKNEVKFIKKLFNDERINNLKDSLLKNCDLCLSIINVIKNELSYECTFKALTIISYSEIFLKIYLKKTDFSSDDIKMLTLFANENPDQIKIAIFKCIQCIVRNYSETFDLKFLINASLPENTEEIRRISGEILKSLQCNQIEGKLLDFSRVLLTLVNDDSEIVRLIASKIITKLIKPDIKFGYFRSFYAQKEYLIFITDFIRKRENSINVIVFLLQLVSYELDDFNDCDKYNDNINDDNDDIRIFNRNEINVFGEIYEIIWMCLKIIQNELNLINMKLNDIKEIILNNDKTLEFIINKIDDNEGDVRKWLNINQF